MLDYLLTTSSWTTVGLVLVAGAIVIVLLPTRSYRQECWKLYTDWSFFMGGSLLSFYTSLLSPLFAGDKTPDEHLLLQDFVRLAAVATTVLLIGLTVKTIIGYRAGRRGGVRRFFRQFV